MATYARIQNGVVVEVIPATAPIATMFTPAFVATLAECDGTPGVAPGWTATETAGVWSFAAPVVVAPVLTLAEQAAAAIAAGLTITLSGSLTLAATVFPCDPTTQTKLNAINSVIAKTGAFPDGATSYPMKDATGAWHIFTASQYEAVAVAIADYVAPLDLMIDGNPLDATTLPSNSISLTV